MMNRANREKILCNARRAFGFEKKRKPVDFMANPALDEVMLAVELATIKTDINWIKRLLWVIVAGGGAGFYFG